MAQLKNVIIHLHIIAEKITAEVIPNGLPVVFLVSVMLTFIPGEHVEEEEGHEPELDKGCTRWHPLVNTPTTNFAVEIHFNWHGILPSPGQISSSECKEHRVDRNILISQPSSNFTDLEITECAGISWSDFIWMTLVTETEISYTVAVGEASITKLGQSKLSHPVRQSKSDSKMG